MKKIITIIISILLLVVVFAGCSDTSKGIVPIEDGTYVAENIIMERDVKGSILIDDDWYVDDNETEEFVINKCAIAIVEGGKEDDHNAFYIKKKLYTLSIALVAQGNEQTIIYVGAKYIDNKIRIGFETDEFYIRIVGEMKCESGKNYIEAVVGYGRSEKHAVEKVKFFQTAV